MSIRFSICIPNYNYEDYLPITIDSILAQTYSDFEILVADNQSTDRSVAIVEQYQAKHPDIKLKQNPTNLGFAGNLDAVSNMATGPYLIMLSSDDLMREDALSVYAKLLKILPAGSRPIVCSAIETIDSKNGHLSYSLAKDAYRQLWEAKDIDSELSTQMQVDVYKVESGELMRRMLLKNANPLNFLATSYPSSFLNRVGGYTSARMINPDKWFNLRILTQADYVYFIDEPLFKYRWHENNQTAQQKKAGALKFLTDEYRQTIEVNREMLALSGLTKDDIESAFIENIIIRHGLGELRKGLWLKSYRINRFGWATYPGIMIKNWTKSFAYGLLLLLGPIGIVLIRLISKSQN